MESEKMTRYFDAIFKRGVHSLSYREKAELFGSMSPEEKAMTRTLLEQVMMEHMENTIKPRTANMELCSSESDE